MTRSTTDAAVGVHKDSDRTVYQCKKSGLLYVLDDPPRRFVSVHAVELARIAAKPQKER